MYLATSIARASVDGRMTPHEESNFGIDHDNDLERYVSWMQRRDVHNGQYATIHTDSWKLAHRTPVHVDGAFELAGYLGPNDLRAFLTRTLPEGMVPIVALTRETLSLLHASARIFYDD